VYFSSLSCSAAGSTSQRCLPVSFTVAQQIDPEKTGVFILLYGKTGVFILIYGKTGVFFCYLENRGLYFVIRKNRGLFCYLEKQGSLFCSENHILSPLPPLKIMILIPPYFDMTFTLLQAHFYLYFCTSYEYMLSLLLAVSLQLAPFLIFLLHIFYSPSSYFFLNYQQSVIFPLPEGTGVVSYKP
jgi:hypothetical protein